MKALIVNTGPSAAYVVEDRQLTGQDGCLCDKGVLIYRVDASVANGSGPIQVQAAGSDNDGPSIDKCGPIYDAPFDLGSGEISRFSDGFLNVNLVSQDSAGAYNVSVSAPHGDPTPSPPLRCPGHDSESRRQTVARPATTS